MDLLHKSFEQRWGVDNDNFIPVPNVDSNIQIELDDTHEKITEEEFQTAIRKLKIDSSAGPDKIIPRSLKKVELTLSSVLSELLNLMIQWNYVPKKLKEAETILLFKGGNVDDCKNWRPITICSVLRRVIEKVLDARLRSVLQFAEAQKGFVREPGTLINSTKLNLCLQDAKKNKKSICVIFLDISQAFDKIGFRQILSQLYTLHISTLIRNFIFNMMTNNQTVLKTRSGKSKPIFMKCGAMQGSSLSPTIFNLCIDPILRILDELEIRKKYGYFIQSISSYISCLSFVDDTTVIGNCISTATELVQMAKFHFESIGLSINMSKCICINIIDGKLCTEDLIIDSTTKVKCIGEGDMIKYLGVTFNNEIIIDKPGIMNKLQKSLQVLTSTTILRADQKLCILNQYIWPTLIYPFQMAPLRKLTGQFLNDVDLMIRSSVKEILMIPNDSPTSMIYASKKHKGSGIFRASWEAYVQNYNSTLVLSKTKDEIIQRMIDFKAGFRKIFIKLDLPDSFTETLEGVRNKSSRQIRDFLKEREFTTWTGYRYKGRGVILFKEQPYANKWIFNKEGLSCSEWTTMIRMIGEVTNVRYTPGRSQDSNRCRFCNETETLSHVLGRCHRGELLRNARHNKVVQLLAAALRDRGFETHIEVHCIALSGSNKRVDILAVNPMTGNGFIIDPTIRMETSVDQPQQVDAEKKSHYEPCVPYFQAKFKLNNIDVIGLLIGARGTITTFFENFRKEFKIPKKVTEDIVIAVIRGSYQIYHNHVYNLTET